MCDENGNLATNGTGTIVSNGSSPNSPPASGMASASVRMRPNVTSPASSDTSYGYQSMAQNGLIQQQQQQNGQVQQQLYRMALVSHMWNQKDPTWLQVEVCREYQRGQCTRNEQECKFAHPPAHVEIQNGKVITCYDSLKNRCKRGTTACKFLHPPQHLKEQVMTNGKNNFVWKNLLMAQMTPQAGPASIASNMGAIGPYAPIPQTGAPLMTGGLATYNPYAPCTLNAVYPNVMIAPPDYGSVGNMLAANPAPTTVQFTTPDQAQKVTGVRLDNLVHMSKRSSLEKMNIPVSYQPVTNSMTTGAPYPSMSFVPAYSFQPPYVPVAYGQSMPRY